MTLTYIVKTKTYGDIHKVADSIADARQWAKVALGADVICVTRVGGKFCDWCQSRPCCCKVNNRAED